MNPSFDFSGATMQKKLKGDFNKYEEITHVEKEGMTF